jgi:DNA-binding LacI/PurR family transcriptional regulator
MGYRPDPVTPCLTTAALLADGLPSAVIAFNDRCAVGLLDTVLRAGAQVPGDLSVVLTAGWCHGCLVFRLEW